MSKVKCVCMHCLKECENPRFLIPAHIEALHANYFDCSPDIIGLDNQKKDNIMEARLRSYDIMIPENEPPRLSCDAREKTLQLKSGLKVIVKPLEQLLKEYPNNVRELENAALIDGKALFISHPICPVVATELICEKCHLILSTKNVVHTQSGSETFLEALDEKKKRKFTVSLIAGSKAGKTNLLLAMRKPENRVRLQLMTEEPYIENFFTQAEKKLENGDVPATTLAPQPPITFRTNKNQDINIIDTRGEEAVEIRIDRAVWSDMLVILLDIISVYEVQGEEEILPGLERLRNYLRELERHFRTRTESKPIILCFTKCDLYPNSANDIMLYTPNGNTNDYDPAKLRVIRNYHFMDNTETIIQNLCKEISSKTKKPNDQIYQSVYRTVQDIISYCNQISGQKVDIMCIAPLGTPAENGKIHRELYSPQHIDDLLHRIVQYASEAET